MDNTNEKENWPSVAANFLKNVSIPITNRADDLFRNYLKDIVIISGVFATIIGTFLIRPEFNNYPYVSKFGFLISIVGFIIITITAIFFLGKSIEELIPGAIYAHKASAILSELSYFDVLLKEGKINSELFSTKKGELLQILNGMQEYDRSAKEKISKADQTEKKILRIISFIRISFIASVCFFVASLILVFSFNNLLNELFAKLENLLFLGACLVL